MAWRTGKANMGTAMRTAGRAVTVVAVLWGFPHVCVRVAEWMMGIR